MSDDRWLEINRLWRKWVREQEANGKIVPPLQIFIQLACQASSDESIYPEMANDLEISESEFREYYFSSRRFELPMG